MPVQRSPGAPTFFWHFRGQQRPRPAKPSANARALDKTHSAPVWGDGTLAESRTSHEPCGPIQSRDSATKSHVGPHQPGSDLHGPKLDPTSAQPVWSRLGRTEKKPQGQGRTTGKPNMWFCGHFQHFSGSWLGRLFPMRGKGSKQVNRGCWIVCASLLGPPASGSRGAGTVVA